MPRSSIEAEPKAISQDLQDTYLRAWRGFREELTAALEELARPAPKLLSINQAARELGISRNLLAKLVSQKLVPSVKRGQREAISQETITRLARTGIPELKQRGRPVKSG